MSKRHISDAYMYAAGRSVHIDKLHYTAYHDTSVSVHDRLIARDTLRRIKEGTYMWPQHLRG